MPDQSITIPLTQGKVAIIDAEDFERVAAFKWCAHRSRNTWYARRATSLGGVHMEIKMHRFIMDAPDGIEVDHINHNGLDNRRSVNLRLATQRQNSYNQSLRRCNTSGYIGVEWQPDCKSWRATIQSDYLGLYATAEDAAHAYDTAARGRYGEFANLNFPDDTHRVEPSKGGLVRTNTSGFADVTYRRTQGKWMARLHHNGKRIFVGYFATAEAAANAREAKMRELLSHIIVK